MNIKIKSSGVFCLVGDDYDRVYAALKHQLGQEDSSLFTERIPGHDYLQWVLPGDGWVALSEGDLIMTGEVRKELLLRQQVIMNRFGSNVAMAQKILSVPDDSYVYYKADGHGQLSIKLTAWGYRYPERISTGSPTGQRKPQDITEHVAIQLEYDRKPLPGKSLRVNGFVRVTDATGGFDIGDLPVGYQFDIDVDDIHRHITVMAGDGLIKVDCTKYVSIEIKVIKDGQSWPGVVATLDYSERKIELTTDADGRATTKLPFELNDKMCSVTVENETQQMLLKNQLNQFIFQLVTPVEEPLTSPEPIINPEPPIEQDPPMETREKMAEVAENSPIEIVEEEPESQFTVAPDEQVLPVDEEIQDEEAQEEEIPEDEFQKEIKREGSSIRTRLWETLFILLLVLLVIFSYYLGKGILFG